MHGGVCQLQLYVIYFILLILCVNMIRKWKLQKRKKVFHSKFVNVYMDRVKLPNGRVIRDYMLVEKSDYVMVVATDIKNRIIIQREYKHGAGEIQFTLPAGLIGRGESPIEAAKRELEEETGYSNGKFTYIGMFTEYATKDLHKAYVVRASELKTKGAQRLEDTEDIEVKLSTAYQIKKQIRDKKWHNSSAIAALALSGILF